MLVSVVGDSIANDDAGIVDRFGDGQDFEVTLRKIAERIEIEHLTVGVKERVLGVVTGERGSNNHPGGVRTLARDAVGRAG